MTLRSLGWGTLAVLLVLSAGCDWPLGSRPPAPYCQPRHSPGRCYFSHHCYHIRSTGPTGRCLSGLAFRNRRWHADPHSRRCQPVSPQFPGRRCDHRRAAHGDHSYLQQVPQYEWVDASGEGIAALDDAARAAVVYLTDYERTGDTGFARQGQAPAQFCHVSAGRRR